jgi:hypothetical protein
MSFLEEGDLLGRYRVEAFLAEGGMGRIYRAVDALLGRRVALKVLAGRARDGAPAIARLLREARAAAALSHPNICGVFDVGEADGQLFIAMELVEGTSLRLVLANPEIGVDQRLRWVHHLACALAAAHRAHLVHRDIKPDNVMIASDGRVRLLDFGVAKWEGSDDAPGPDAPDDPGAYRTGDGEIVGTSGYMAPEQAVGGQVDARTDQFAWGVVAYETISGRHPFAADDCLGEPHLLSSLVPGLPPGVAAIIARALEIDRSLRFADMDDIVALLQPPGMEAIWVLGPADGPVVVQFRGGPVASPAGLAMVGADGQLRWQLHDALEPGIALAPDGRHVLASRQSIPGQAELVAVPLDGSPVVSLASTGIAARDGLAVAPDGRQLAWSTCRPAPVVSGIDGTSRFVPVLTKEGDDVLALARIPGGRDLAVVSGRTGRPRLWVMDPAGQRPPRPIAVGDHDPGDVAVSPDGARFAVSLPGAGIAIGPLHGGGEPRMLTDHPDDEAPCFRAAGDAVVFTRRGAGGVAQVMVAPIAGGPPVALLGPGSHDAQVSPIDDTIVYLPAARGVPMVADARGGGGRPLSPALTADAYRDVRFSPDGARVLVLRGHHEVIELDVATGAIVRSVAAPAREQFYSPAYGDAGPLVIRVRWQGNIYVADAAFRPPAISNQQ